MQPKQSAFDNIQEDKIDELILNYLNTPKFQTSLNSLIISTLSNRKNMSLSRKGIADKIISHEYIKDVENEILQNLFTAFDIENYNTNELINLKYKNLMQKNNNIQKTDLSLTCLKTVDFEQLIANRIDAIEFNLSNDWGLYMALYGWDCDSTLILNPDVIKII